MSKLRFDALAKRFGGTQALKGVSFSVRSGEVVALLGENGAGKSTVIKILGGIHKADAGQISIDGMAYQHESQSTAGVRRTVAEPLNLQGWQLVDELNRAFAGEAWSGYVSPLHIVTKANIEFDGGPTNTFDPENGYRDAYKPIWGVQ